MALTLTPLGAETTAIGIEIKRTISEGAPAAPESQDLLPPEAGNTTIVPARPIKL